MTTTYGQGHSSDMWRHGSSTEEEDEREQLMPADAEEGAKPGHLGHEARRRSSGWKHWGIFSVATLICLLSTLMLMKIAMFDVFVKSNPSPVPTPTPAPTPSAVPTPSEEPALVSDFRRPSSEYVLGGKWDYDAQPTVREYNWVIQDIIANPDGVFRPMITINGKFPGEMIRCNEGDKIIINVDNQSVNSTAIHWHGIFQNGSNWMDGAAGVTQCPIAPGRKFRYEFTVTGQAGTYFYHGHHAGQALDGLVGPFIIHNRDEFVHQDIPYTSDQVVMIQDWYHELSSVLLEQKLSPGSESEPAPNGALINGIGVVDCSKHPNHRCDNSTAHLIPAFDVSANSYHRFRLLNVGGFAWFEVTLDQHSSFAVSEIDGVNIMPSPEESVVMGPGQRYSITINTFREKTDVFWLRARILSHCFGENVAPNEDMIEAHAVVRYTSDPPAAGDPPVGTLPTTENDSAVFATDCLDMHTRAYVPVPEKPAPEYAHHSYYFRVNMEIGDWRLERGFMNQSSLRPNLESPTLHRVVDGLRSKNQAFEAEGVNDKAFDATTELVISNKEVEVVDIILQNFDESNHPFHLHGHQMFILGQGHGYFPGYEALGLAPEGKGLLDPGDPAVIENPTRRDVATVESFGWSLVRFVADNPGLWLFHCHMIWHSESGMAMQFASRLGVMEKWDIPKQNRELCKASTEDLEKGSPPKDSTWFGQMPSDTEAI